MLCSTLEGGTNVRAALHAAGPVIGTASVRLCVMASIYYQDDLVTIHHGKAAETP